MQVRATYTDHWTIQVNKKQTPFPKELILMVLNYLSCLKDLTTCRKLSLQMYNLASDDKLFKSIFHKQYPFLTTICPKVDKLEPYVKKRNQIIKNIRENHFTETCFTLCKMQRHKYFFHQDRVVVGSSDRGKLFFSVFSISGKKTMRLYSKSLGRYSTSPSPLQISQNNNHFALGFHSRPDSLQIYEIDFPCPIWAKMFAQKDLLHHQLIDKKIFYTFRKHSGEAFLTIAPLKKDKTTKKETIKVPLESNEHIIQSSELPLFNQYLFLSNQDRLFTYNEKTKKFDILDFSNKRFLNDEWIIDFSDKQSLKISKFRSDWSIKFPIPDNIKEATVCNFKVYYPILFIQFPNPSRIIKSPAFFIQMFDMNENKLLKHKFNHDKEMQMHVHEGILAYRLAKWPVIKIVNYRKPPTSKTDTLVQKAFQFWSK